MNPILLGGAALLLLSRLAGSDDEGPEPEGESADDMARRLSQEAREAWEQSDVPDATETLAEPATRPRRRRAARAPERAAERRDREAEIQDADERAAQDALAAALAAEAESAPAPAPPKPRRRRRIVSPSVEPAAEPEPEDEYVRPVLVVDGPELVEDAGLQYREGVEPDRAAAMAPAVAADIKSRRYDYSRARLREFQGAAGIVADGLYGGGSAGALRYWLGAPPPRPLFKPTTEREYSPWQA